MKRVLLSLCLAAIALAGCSSSSNNWDRNDISQKIQANYNRQLSSQGAKETCTKVTVVESGENSFQGLAEFSDGSQKSITVNVDPRTGDFIF